MEPTEQTSQPLFEETPAAPPVLPQPLFEEMQAGPLSLEQTPISPMPPQARLRPSQRLAQHKRPPLSRRQRRQAARKALVRHVRRLLRLTPKERSQVAWILVGGIIAVVLIVCITGAIALAVNGQKALSDALSHPTAGATLAPTDVPTQEGAAHLQVGDSVTTVNWQVTITSASAYAGNDFQFETPREGDTFLVVRGTFQNLTDQSQPLSTLLFFTLQDTQGNTYPEAVFNSLDSPNSPIQANRSTQGEWGYEVPASIHAFILIFNDPIGHATFIWDITI